MRSNSSRWEAGTISAMDWPTASAGEYPYIRCAPAFQLTIVPSSALPMIASSDDSTMARRRTLVSSSGRNRDTSDIRNWGDILANSVQVVLLAKVTRDYDECSTGDLYV